MSGENNDGNKRLAIIGVASLFLVAMVIGVTIGVNNADNSSDKGNLSATSKAIENICQPTDYKDTCKATLQKGAPNTENPNALVKAAFNAALEEINNITEHSSLLKELQKNPKTAKAAHTCKELFGYAVDDFRRSMVEIGNFDLSNMQVILSNLKSWLSATVTYQETCLDGFHNISTDAAGKVRKMLNTSMQMSSNGIAIVAGISSVVGDLQLSGLSSGSKRRLLSSSKSRRLMTWSDEFVVGHYEFVDDDFLEEISRRDHRKRRLLSSGDYNVGHDDVIPRWMDLDDRRRKLLQAKTIDEVKPNIIVAKDGSGKFKSIGHAFNVIPQKSREPFVIFVKEGVYKEYLTIQKWQTNVVLIGAGPTKTRITGNLNYIDGTETFKTCTVAALGDHFMAKDIGIENTAGPEKHQAVALRVQSDQAIFYNCHFDGYQDTLYAHTYRQFYRDCQISGTIDFVFGDAAAFFQNCTFVVRKPLDNQNCIVTAQGRKERHEPTGIIIHKSNIIADPEYFPVRFKNKAYLGRPWKEYSKTIFMETKMDDLIQPDGWMPWDKDFALKTCYYGEYRNEGPGANMEHRVKWPGVKTILPSRAEKFMPPLLFEGDEWIIASGVPYIPALTSDPTSFVAPPGALDEDPTEKYAASGGDKSHKKDKSSKSPKNKSKDKSSDEDSDESSSKSSRNKSSDEDSDKSSSKSSKHKSSDDSSDKSSSNSSKNKSSDDSSDKSSSKSPHDSSASKSSKAPSSEPLPADDESSISSAPSISESPSSNPSIPSTPTQSVSIPSESPAADLETTTLNLPNQDNKPLAPSPSTIPSLIVNNKRSLIQTNLDEVTESPNSSPSASPSSLQDELPSNAPSESTLKVVNHERTATLVDLEKMLMQGETPTTTPTKSPSLMQEEPPTSAPSESTSKVVNLKRTTMLVDLEKMLMQGETPTNAPTKNPSLMQEEPPTSAPSESTSKVVNLKRTAMLVDLKKMLMQGETPTNTPTITPLLMQEEPPTSTPSESPSSSTKLERTVLQVEAPTSTTSAPSESPSSMVKLERKLIVDLEKMLMQGETPTTTPTNTPLLMQEEPPTSTPSESPSSSTKLERTVLQVEAPTPTTSAPSESPSSSTKLERTVMQVEAPTPTTSAPSESPSSMVKLERKLIVDLKKMLMQGETPTITPTNTPLLMQEEPPTSTPSESPSSSTKLERTVLQVEAPMPTTSAPSESPSSMVKLERKLIVDLEKMLMKGETPTTTPTNTPLLMQEEPPTSTPSESPSSSTKLERTVLQVEAPTPTTSAPSESPSSMVKLERKLIVDLKKMLMQGETPTITPTNTPLLMQEEPPTSTPSESPSLSTKLERTVLQVEAQTPTTSAPSESPSSMVKLERKLIVDLEKMLMQGETPTIAPTNTPLLIQDEPPTSTPSEGPSSSTNLDRTVLQVEAPTPTTSAPSESPASVNNLERMLIQSDPDDEDEDDDHDKLVDASTVREDEALEALHLRSRQDLSLDETVTRARPHSSRSPNPAPEAMPPHSTSQSPRSAHMAPETAIRNLERELVMESVIEKAGEANVNPNNTSGNHDAQLAQAAQLASSPQSKNYAASLGQANQNGTSINGTSINGTSINGTALAGAPGANQLFQQLGVNGKADAGGEQAQKSGSSGGYEIRFGFNLVAILVVLFVGV